MVASLQHRKEALEAKIRDKTSELRKVCIEEAELTGFLPPETPLEPGESPPQFRRRVGTSFAYPESLINKLKSKEKEDEQLAALELEIKIQTGIAEAALSIANDGTANKAVRRKHRLLYEESQRRLSELEARLNEVKQAQPKHKKKPRPQTDIENDCVDGHHISEMHSDPGRYKSLHMVSTQDTVSDKFPAGIMKTPLGVYPKSESNLQAYHQWATQNNMVVPNFEYRHSTTVPDFHHHNIRSANPSPNGLSDQSWWAKSRESLPIRQSPLLALTPQDFYVEPLNVSDRFGSLDRNSQLLQSLDHESRFCSTLPRNSYMNPGTNASVLLPSQTYPENSLMRTQSLGSVDNSKLKGDHPERKSKQKEWYETSLDSSPPKLASKVDSPTPPILATISAAEEKPALQGSNLENSCANYKPNQASINSIQFDTVVPYESPKNHMVVQAGMWQPYREVTKPFEMSDFYKYSTKFRKGQMQNQTQSQNMNHGVSQGSLNNNFNQVHPNINIAYDQQNINLTQEQQNSVIQAQQNHNVMQCQNTGHMSHSIQGQHFHLALQNHPNHSQFNQNMLHSPNQNSHPVIMLGENLVLQASNHIQIQSSLQNVFPSQNQNVFSQNSHHPQNECLRSPPLNIVQSQNLGGTQKSGQGNVDPSLPQHQHQQKGIYKPLQRLECHAVTPPQSFDNMNQKTHTQQLLSTGDGGYSPEVSWYQEKSGSPKPRSSTLV